MSSAYYETTGKMKGSSRNLADMIGVILEYTQGLKDAYFMDLIFDNGTEKKKAEELADKALAAFVGDTEEISFSAGGPYGKYDELNDVDMFRKMAEAAPAAYLNVSVDGQDSYAQEEMQCRLQDGILKIDITRNETEDGDRAYLDYILGKMPYARFMDLFDIVPDSLAEDDYEDFISDLIIDAGENEISPFSLDYSVFCERLGDYGGETSLDEEAYENAGNQEETAGIVSAYEFSEENDCSVTRHYEFDAVRGVYFE